MAQQRELWNNRSGFILAAIGAAVGLGNIWRFPYVCYQNGGGAFLIPYFVALITAGIPLMILEMGIGHMMRGGAPLSFSKVDRKWEWVGWAALLMGFIVLVYYAVVMAWCFSYLKYSFTLAWGEDTGGFFGNQFLGKTSDPADLGGVRWPILAGLVVTWVCIYLIIFRGIRTVSKVVLATVPLPLLIIVIFVIRGVTLPGALDGLNFYLTPDFSRLLDPKVWLAAYGQVFFSLSLSFGIMIAYASYVPSRSDITNSALIISLSNCGTSFLAGFAVFSALGYLAHIQGTDIQNVVSSGPGLAFVTYPLVINKLPFWPQLFGVLFFVLLLTLGIDSAFSLVEGVVAGFMDKWGGYSRKRVVGYTCFVALILGIIFTTGAGVAWLDIVDHFVNNFGLTFIGFLECLVIGYILGSGKLRKHLNSVSEVKVGLWWELFIKVITPLILVVSFGLSLWERIKAPYENYPEWALLLGGWLLLAVALVVAFLFGKIRSAEEL